MTISIEVEPIPGSDIYEVMADMCRQSDRLGMMVTATINGVYLTAYRSTPDELRRRYERTCEFRAEKARSSDIRRGRGANVRG